MRLVCAVYKSVTKDDMYLYVEKKDELSRVPQALQELFGKPKLAMTMILDKDKALAHVDVAKVIEDIKEKGYFLQLPSKEDDYMMEVHKHNTKL